MTSTNRTTVESYNKTAKQYVKRDTTRSREVMYEAWVDPLLKMLSLDAHILEIGSSYGRDAKYFQERGYAIDVTDASESFVAMLRSDGFEAEILDILVKPADRLYDLIFASAVLLHFNETELVKALKNIHDSLKQGGIFTFSLIEGGGEETIDTALDTLPRFFKHYDRKILQTLLIDNNFSIDSVITKEFGGKTWLYYIVTKK